MTEDQLNQEFWDLNRKMSELDPDFARAFAEFWNGLSMLRKALEESFPSAQDDEQSN